VLGNPYKFKATLQLLIKDEKPKSGLAESRMQIDKNLVIKIRIFTSRALMVFIY